MTTLKLSALQWAQERFDNSVRIAAGCEPADREGWLEDVAYWREIVTRLGELEASVLTTALEQADLDWRIVASDYREKCAECDALKKRVKFFEDHIEIADLGQAAQEARDK